MHAMTDQSCVMRVFLMQERKSHFSLLLRVSARSLW